MLGSVDNPAGFHSQISQCQIPKARKAIMHELDVSSDPAPT
jgi:hypothetical protein